jgi:hypothetical protein
MKNQKGVSLITLVITIIVVIILAAIALGGGAADTAGQAQFSGFATEMGGLKESVQTAIQTAKGTEAIRGNSRSNAQLANYVARGGDNVLTADDAGDKKWLVQSDADSIPCTLIDKQYAEDVLGAKLPVRKVETYKGTNQEVSYFVTPKGQVFCWPPYTYDGKSYVTNNVTAKAGTITDSTSYAAATEYSDTDATKVDDVTLYFPDTDEIVKVSNNSDSTVSAATRGKVGSGDTAVWYKGTTSTDNRGVAEGITFTTYDNTVTTP